MTSGDVTDFYDQLAEDYHLMRSALDHAGFTNVAWLMPEDTGFYQPVVTAHAE
ncbi:MAG: hypothetical protein H0U14_07530 [Thermoleophilaceae bacterium]|nr:hypothetical protein [Thermoleophilaceae bacterium]